MLDLQQYCARENEDPRVYIRKPWSMGAFSYATNGHIIVRVPRRDDVPEDPENPITEAKVARALGKPMGEWRKPTIIGLPALADEECDDCEGLGKACHCETCDCECDTCDGAGRIESDRGKSARYFAVPFALKYVRKLCSFPNVEVCDPASDSAPLAFRFDGGDGAIMPLRMDDASVVRVFAEHDGVAKEMR